LSAVPLSPHRTRSQGMRRRAAYGLMAASGFAGLGYQIVWTQQCALWLGHESAAVLAVIAAFFGGLAVGALVLGRQAQIIGRNADSSWWYVRNPSDPSTSCWLSAEFVDTVGNVQALPVVNAPVIMVTNVQVLVDPPVMNVACDALPQVVTITARITASGPSTVVWHWQSSTGFVSPDKNVLFVVGDTKTVQDYYQVNGVNDYIVQVQTSLPNIMTGQASFKVVCTP